MISPAYYKELRQLIIYCIIGGCGASIDFIIYSYLTIYEDVFYQYANLIGVTAGITTNFFLNAYFNFKKTNHLVERLISFYLVGMLGCLISAILLNIQIERLGFGEIFSKLTAIVIVTAVQFTLNRLITFRDKKTKPSDLK